MDNEGLIRRFAPELSAKEAEGVEQHLARRYGTLDAVPVKTVRRKTRLALQCEELTPGYLERCRKSTQEKD